jgi:DNA invertase Pin-like site-specific DNA recombinase
MSEPSDDPRRLAAEAICRAVLEAQVEVESGKRDDNRPALAKAFEACKAYRATLVIAKLDRLSRDAHFLLGLQKARPASSSLPSTYRTPTG